MANVIRITAKPRAGFRRCGVFHPSSPVDHPIDRFTTDELATLQAESQLMVQLVDVEGKRSSGEKSDDETPDGEKKPADEKSKGEKSSAKPEKK